MITYAIALSAGMLLLSEEEAILEACAPTQGFQVLELEDDQPKGVLTVEQGVLLSQILS